MKYVHPGYKTLSVLRYIDDLIINDDVKSISDLTKENRLYLSGLLLKTEPLTEILNFISQNDNDEKFRDLLVNCLVDPMKERDDFFMKMLFSFSEDYYEPMIESILNERLDHYATF